ncbi:peptidoglycan editing factor PgeF [Luteimonas suaedae]|uniref:peptidoglycan editing factor PgeF n=1 Tax=Luteimonas suaedae TaxID=2605430 RepID=UPI0011EDA727|nr:peptidoglycan editing factor PgeF [Luteimonas suaedae]
MNAALHAEWPAPPGVVAFTTLRHGAGVSRPPFDSFNLGVRSGDDAGAVQRNRDALVARFGLPSAPHWLRQVHGTAVCRFDAAASDDPVVAGAGPEPAAGDEPEADASVTSEPGVVLAVLTADCLPVVLAAKDGSAIAAAHAGWRGLAAGVLERTVAAMHARPGDLVAWLGPAAGPQAYEVDAGVREAFVAHDAGAGVAFTSTRPGHWRADLYALARMRLASAGLADGDVHGGGLCTISDPNRFFSYRRDTRTGRMATVVYRA